MKVLIFSVNAQSPHLETDFELAKTCIERGDLVTIVRSTGQLKACLDNPNHNWIGCAACQSKFNKAVDLTKLDKVDIRTLPDVAGDYSRLPKQFSTIEELKRFTIDGLDAGNAVATTLMGRLDKNHKFQPSHHKRAVSKELEMWLDIYTGCQQLLDEIQPDEVYFFNGRFSSYHPLRHLCIRRNITYYTHERGGVINKFILRKNVLPHNIEYTINEICSLWDAGNPQREQIGSKFFTDRRGRVIQSWVSFTESQKKDLLPEGFDPTKKNIVIFNSTMEEYEGMADWMNPIYKDDNDGITQILESFEHEEDFVIYLRVHPNLKHLKNAQVREIEGMAQRFPKCVLIRAEQNVDSYALLDAAHKVISFGSTIGAEATYWGKVSVLLGKSAYMNLEACYEPKTHSEAVELLKDDSLIAKPKVNAVKYGYWEIMKGQPYKYFNQLNLFTMAVGDSVVQPSVPLKVLQKLSRFQVLTKKRNLLTMAERAKKLLKWK